METEIKDNKPAFSKMTPEQEERLRKCNEELLYDINIKNFNPLELEPTFVTIPHIVQFHFHF